MLNLFKMYCYKMFRQKSLYIIWLIMFGFELLSVPMAERDFAGLSIEMGGFYIMLVSIFPAIFFSGEFSSGFIKNYAGSIPCRTTIIVSGIAMIVVQNLLTLAVMFGSLCGIGIFKGMDFAKSRFIATYYICMFLVGLACSFISMMFTELMRKTVSSIILTIAVGTGLVSQLAGTISGLMSDGNFLISSYMVTGRFNQLSQESTTMDFNATMMIAVCYMLLSATVSIVNMNKQDIV